MINAVNEEGTVECMVQGSLAALAGISLWTILDLLHVFLLLDARAPIALAAFSLILSTLAAVGVGSTIGLLARGKGWVARRASFLAAFGASGFVVVGVTVNRLYLPSIWHPLSLAVNLAVGVILLAVAQVLSRGLSGHRGLRAAVCGVVAAWVGTLTFAAAWTPATEVRHGDSPRSREQVTDLDVSRNVLFVVFDSLRADALGASIESASTPALARLAAEGAVFARAYSQSSWTKPAVASLLTGQYPGTHGAEGRGDALPSQLTTLPEILAGFGYRTSIFSANPWVSPTFGFSQGVEHFVESEPGGDPSRLLAFVRCVQVLQRRFPSPLGTVVTLLRRSLGLLAPHRTNCERDQEIVDAALAWLGADDSRPFFSYLHLMSPHLPYETQAGSRVDRSRQLAAQRGRLSLSPGERTLLRREYQETLGCADEQLARLVQGLRRRGNYDQTLVIVTADHGDELYDHEQLGHGKTLYPEVVHVPLLISLTGVILPGVVVERRISAVDVLPTVLGLLRLPVPQGVAGQVIDLSSGADQRVESRPVFLSLRREGGLTLQSVVTDGYQYIESQGPGFASGTRRELYDLRRDPRAAQNIWTPDSIIALRMSKSLASLADSDSHGSSRRVNIDSQTQDRLRSLGYVN